MNDNPTERFPWEEPPSPNGAGFHIDTKALRAQLMSAPGRWARVRSYTTSRTAHSYKGGIRGGESPWNRPRGAFDATVRQVDGEYVVYVRYVGQNGAR